MGEALGVDLRATAVAAARLRDGELVACQLGDGTSTVPATELMDAVSAEPVATDGGPADDDPLAVTGGLLAAVVERALDGDAACTVAVTYGLAPDDGARAVVEQATATTFDDAFIVARPVAVAARFVRGGDGRQDARIAVLDVSERAVDVTIVRCARDGFDVVGPPATLPDPGHEVDMAEHLDRAVSLLEAAVTGADLAAGDIDAVLVVGRSDWLSQLALQTRVGTGLVVAIDPEPDVAAALGAALLAGGPERRGRVRPKAVAGLGPLAGAQAPHLAPATAGPAGAGAGAAAGEAAAVADGAGGHLGEAAADAISGVPGALKGPTGSATSATTGGGAGAAVGSGSRRVGSALGGVVGAAGASRRGRILAAAAAAAVVAGLVGLGVGVRALVADDGKGTVEIGESRPGATTTTTTESAVSPHPGSGTKPGSDGPVSTTTADPGATAEGPGDGTVAPEGTAPTDGPGGAGTPGTPVPDGGGDTPSPPPPSDDPVPLTTVPGDIAPPSISGVTSAPATITEDDGEFCTGPFTAQIAATVSDPSGVQQVTAHWGGNGTSGSLAMTASGGTWNATLGPVAGNAALSYPETATVNWSVTAVDGAGNSAGATGPAITIQGC